MDIMDKIEEHLEKVWDVEPEKAFNMSGTIARLVKGYCDDRCAASPIEPARRKKEPGDILWADDSPVEYVEKIGWFYIVKDYRGVTRRISGKGVRHATPDEVKEFFTWRNGGYAVLAVESYDTTEANSVALYENLGLASILSAGRIVPRFILDPEIRVMPLTWRKKVFGDTIPAPDSESSL